MTHLARNSTRCFCFLLSVPIPSWLSQPSPGRRVASYGKQFATCSRLLGMMMWGVGPSPTMPARSQVLRADAVPLVDAWGHSDHCLNSALGRRDGRVPLGTDRGRRNPVGVGWGGGRRLFGSPGSRGSRWNMGFWRVWCVGGKVWVRMRIGGRSGDW